KFFINTFKGRQKPNHFIFDSNCILSKHVCKHNDKSIRTFFDDIGLAVDVFHHKSKHSVKDLWCGSQCNPAKFPELMYPTKTGNKWLIRASSTVTVPLR
ncbi:hypothetical protein BT96DRAFT_831664, partial [Gymnopus androsaceus JB14]